MQKFCGGLAVVVLAASIVGGTGSAASADTTDVTFTLSGGALSVAAPSTADMGTRGASGTTSVSGSLGDTVVTDNRGGTTGWSVTASTTAMGNDDTTATGVTYNAGTPTFTGVVTAVPRGAVALTSTPTEVVAGTVVLGNNTATWNPTLTVTLPASSTVGAYTGTITTSVL